MNDVVNDLRLKAAAILGERGWCKNVFKEVDGRVCVRGALIQARAEELGNPEIASRNMRDLAQSDGIVQAAERAIATELGLCTDGGDWLGAWNNAMCRTKRQAFTALRGTRRRKLARAPELVGAS